MKILLALGIGLYAALGPLCPMQLAAAGAAMHDDAVMSVASSMHDIDAHDADLQCTAVAHHSACGESEHCQLAEMLDSAGAIAVQEVPAACFAGVMMIPIDTVSALEEHRTMFMDRPPPLSQLATVVLLQ